MKKDINIDEIKTMVEKTINSDNSQGSYNSAWVDGFRYLANKIFDISWDNKTKKFEIK